MPGDRQWIDFEKNLELAKLSAKDFVTPYDVLTAEITERIRQFYKDITLSTEAIEQLEKYGLRAKVFHEQFAQRCNEAEGSAVKIVLQALDRSIMQKKDVRKIISDIQYAVEKRIESVQAMILDSYRQMLLYMVLWEYQDHGYSQYKYITKDENCSVCAGLDGQIFSIEEARTGTNLAPYASQL